MADHPTTPEELQAEEVRKVRDLHAAERERQKQCHVNLDRVVKDHAGKHAETPRLLHMTRAAIDAIDGEIVALLRRREYCVEVAAMLKQAAGLPVHDPIREDALVKRHAPAQGLVQALYRGIIERCREHAKSIGKAPVPSAVDGGGEKGA